MDVKMTPTTNPLRQFFRQPAIYLRLPSQGKFWPEGTVNIPENGELPVLPMTAIDEITYRTPDALFNGQAVVSVIQSCVPNIVNAWATPSVDIDAILTAIRIASYGHELEIDSRCPGCDEENTYNLDLRVVLDGFRLPAYDECMINNDLEIHFVPLNYKQIHDNNTLQFSDQKLLQMLPSSELPEDEKVKVLADALRKITEMTVVTISQTISLIQTPGAIVTDRAHIIEFLKNCDRTLFTNIRDHVIKLRTDGELKPLQVKCTNCENTYTQPFTLDQANFFAPAS